MAWTRLDDMLPMHPKVRSLTDAAFRLYVCSICWSNLHLSDGYIESQHLRFISDVRRPRPAADELVQAELWETTLHGWRIHDYLKYQPSAERVEHERALKRQRQSRWRERGDASTDASRHASREHAPYPSQTPGGPVILQGAGSRDRPESDTVLTDAVKAEMFDRGFRQVTDGQAAKIVQNIIGQESVRNPVAYITAAIKREANPARFLPTPLPPPVDEVQYINGKPARGQTVHAIAAQARTAITREGTHD